MPFSKLDSRKLFIVMSVAVITLTIESQIAYVSDFIPGQVASGGGIAAFAGMWAIFTVTQYYILAFVSQKNKGRRTRVRQLEVAHKVVTIAQFVLAGIIALAILQVLLAQEYNIALLYAALSISYGLWIATLGLLARALFSWYRLSYNNPMILILALSMAAYVANGALGLYVELDRLAQQNQVIRSGDVAVFPEFSAATLGDQLNIANHVASSVAYVLTWIGTVMMLRPYLKMGGMKFWAIMAAAMAYYLVQFPLFVLGYYNPSEDTDVMTNILIFSMAAVFTGIVFGAAFLSVARTLRHGSAVRDYMIIAAYGFVLFYVAGSSMLSQAAYPPYGMISVSFTGISCYLIYHGLYAAAISVSQDTALRQSIRNSVKEQSKLLDSIGTAQMEREMQARVVVLTKKAADTMTEKTGIEATMTEDDMKAYLELVVNEIKKDAASRSG